MKLLSATARFSESREAQQTESRNLEIDDKVIDSSGTDFPDQTAPGPNPQEMESGSSTNEFENNGNEEGSGNSEKTTAENFQVTLQKRDRGDILSTDTNLPFEEKVTND